MIKLPKDTLKNIIEETRRDIEKQKNKQNNSKEEKITLQKIKKEIDSCIYELKQDKEFIENRIIKIENMLSNKTMLSKEVIEYQETSLLENKEKYNEIIQNIYIKEIEKKIAMSIILRKNQLKRVPKENELSEEITKKMYEIGNSYLEVLQKFHLIEEYNIEENERLRIERLSREILDKYILKNKEFPEQKYFVKKIKLQYSYIKNLFGLTYKDYLISYLKYDKSLYKEKKGTRSSRNQSNEMLIKELQGIFQHFKEEHGRYPYISEFKELKLYSTTHYTKKFEVSFTNFIRDIAGFKDYKFIRKGISREDK